MKDYHTVLLISFSCILSSSAKPPALDKFKFTNWFAMPGKHTDREWHLSRIEQLLKFYETYTTELDIGAGLSLISAKSSFVSTMEAMKYNSKQFKEHKVGVDCVTQGDLILVERLLNRTTNLMDILIDYMRARVNILNQYRRFASGFLLNQENWQKNLKQFPINVYTMKYSRRLANSWTVPSPDMYKKRLYNMSFIIPTLPETEECLMEIYAHPSFVYGFPQLCMISEMCTRLILAGDNFGFGLSHRIFILTYARFTKNCYFINIGSDDRLIAKLCSLARLEMDYLVKIMEWTIPDLILEFMVYCTMNGHRMIMRQQWFVDLENNYASADGNMRCYVQGKFKKKRPSIGNPTETVWELTRGSNAPLFGPCERHLTGLALAAHAAAFRACAQPVFCSKAQNKCCIPYNKSLIWEEYGLKAPLAEQRRWYPWKYMVDNCKTEKHNIDAGCAKTSATSYYFHYTNDKNPYYWACRPPISDDVTEPNAELVKFDPSDKGIDVD